MTEEDFITNLITLSEYVRRFIMIIFSERLNLNEIDCGPIKLTKLSGNYGCEGQLFIDKIFIDDTYALKSTQIIVSVVLKNVTKIIHPYFHI